MKDHAEARAVLRVKIIRVVKLLLIHPGRLCSIRLPRAAAWHLRLHRLRWQLQSLGLMRIIQFRRQLRSVGLRRQLRSPGLLLPLQLRWQLRSLGPLQLFRLRWHLRRWQLRSLGLVLRKYQSLFMDLVSYVFLCFFHELLWLISW